MGQSAPAPQRGARGLPGRLAAVLRATYRYLGAVLGEDSYDRYVEHLKRTHPNQEPMTVREFWRARHEREDANPGSRCC